MRPVSTAVAISFSISARRSPASGSPGGANAVAGADCDGFNKLDVLQQVCDHIEIEQRPEPPVDRQRLPKLQGPDQPIENDGISRECDEGPPPSRPRWR